MDVLSSVPWGTVTPVGALVAVLVYVLRTVSRGDWIPRSTHEEIVSHKDATISTQEETIRVQDSQLEDLSIVGETQVKSWTASTRWLVTGPRMTRHEVAVEAAAARGRHGLPGSPQGPREGPR